MVSKFWQPGLDANTKAGKGVRRAVLLGSNEVETSTTNSSRGTGEHVLPSEACLAPDLQSPVRKMRGQISGPSTDRRLNPITQSRSSNRLKKSLNSKNTGKKLVGVGQGSRRSFLTFDRKRTKIPLVDMDPTTSVQTVIKIFENCLRNRPKQNQWDAVNHVKHMYREYFPPAFTQKRIGSIPGIEVGDIFKSRAALSLVGLHGQSQAGIDYVHYTSPGISSFKLVAVSIVVSGVYEDDCDEGDILVYTGEGGNDLAGSRRQIKDQKLEGGNLALVNSHSKNLPIRVMRARPADDLNSSSAIVYSYDGLYKLGWWAEEVGISNFKVFKYRLFREPNQPPLRWFRRAVHLGSNSSGPIEASLAG